MKTFSTNEICALCGVTRKQIRYYEDHGILSQVPRIDDNNYRYYTHDHICEIAATKELKNMNMALSEMKDIVYGQHIQSIQTSIEKKMKAARENLELSLLRYEQCTVAYAKLTEAIASLKLHQHSSALDFGFEITEFPEYHVVSLPYQATFEDEELFDIEYMARIQTIASQVNTAALGALIYLLYDHFDSASVTFDHQVHDFKVAVPVVDTRKPSEHYDRIPTFRGVSTLHIGSPKNRKLHDTYIRLLTWAKENGYELSNQSLEEWLISPMITNNTEFWIIRIFIPFKGEAFCPEPKKTY